MKILFFMARPGHIRNYDSTLRLLAERGHTIHLAFSSSRPKQNEPPDIVQAETLARDCPEVTYDDAPGRKRGDGWSGLVGQIRLWGDFARFLHPRYREAPLLRDRARRRLERGIRSSHSGPVASALVGLSRLLSRHQSRIVAAAIGSFCRRAAQAVPPSDVVTKYVRRHRPDVVLVTPAVEIGSAQAEYFKAAHSLEIPTGFCVASWDNLTNKGILRIVPDAVFVWNDIQRREAVELHHIPSERVVITGAPRFDEWFTRRPSRSDRELKQAAGLDPDHPYVLYLCSSPFIAPDEVTFVSSWLRAVRASEHSIVRMVGVLIRPHPQNAAQWSDVDLEAFGNVTIWPRAAAQVTDDESKADFFDSIAHAAAVVGINTTALIEAAILGKRAYTVTAEDFSGTQQGTLHYHYLREEQGGFLHEAASVDESLAQMQALFDEGTEGLERTRRFVRDFVRPYGLDTPATPALAIAIEELAESAPSHPRPSVVSAGLRPPLAVVAATARMQARWTARRRRLRLRARLGQMLAHVRPAPRTPGKRAPGHGGKRRRTADYSELALEQVSVAHRHVGRLFARATDVVSIGPWWGDLTSETLYWIPCVRWLLERHGFPPERLVVISRNGDPAWYSDLASSVRTDAGPSGMPCPVNVMVEAMLARETPLRVVIKRSLYARLRAPAHEWPWDLPPDYVVVARENEPEDVEGSSDVGALLESALPPPSPTLLLRRDPFQKHGWTLDRQVSGSPLETVDTGGLSAIVAGASAVIGPPLSPAVTLSVCHGVRAIALTDSLSEDNWRRVDLLTRVAQSLGSSFTLLDPTQVDRLAYAISRRPSPSADIVSIPAFRHVRSPSADSVGTPARDEPR